MKSLKNKGNNISENTIQPAPKANKKKVIVISAVIAVVAICIVAASIAIIGNRNSQWKKPLDEESAQYGYSVTPEEYIAKANEFYTLYCDAESDILANNFEIDSSESMDDYDRYLCSIDRPVTIADEKTFNLHIGESGIDYYSDNTIRQVIMNVPYQDDFVEFQDACHTMAYSAVQFLYAYNEFEKDVPADELKTLQDTFKEVFENANSFENNFFRYNDFVFLIYESDDQQSAIMIVEKTDEEGIEKVEKLIGSTMINIADTASSNDDKAEAAETDETEEIETTEETETTEAKKTPEDCFVSTNEIYEQVKPFFAKYGYDIDSWDVTIDDGDIFSAETGSEALVLKDSSLMINLDKGGNTTRGLTYFADDNIQLWFDGGEKDKAYELLDIIFDGVQVDDKKLSEYIESEYESHLNEGNVSNWNNGNIRYSIQFVDDLTFISLYLD